MRYLRHDSATNVSIMAELLAKIFCNSTLLIPLLAITILSVVSTSRAEESLLYAKNLVYQGAFRVPGGNYGCNDSNKCSLRYGGTAIAFNPAKNSLFIVGHDWNQQVAEIGIPPVVNSTAIGDLKTAAILQPFADITQGHRQKIKAGGESYAGTVKIGGLMVYQGALIGTVYAYYDAGNKQVSSHFKRSIDLNAGDLAGMFEVGKKPSRHAGFVSGYMTQIPKSWQSALGGPALTGNAAIAIVSRTSLGPAAFVFNPEDLGKTDPAPATPVVYYPIAHPSLGKWASTNSRFNGSTQIKGVVFPVGSRSVLFFGRQGLGDYCYGAGTGDRTLVAKGNLSKGVETICYDPAVSSKGNHAYPYAYQVWAYDVKDLVAVKNEDKLPWEIKPYAVWNFDLPFQPENRSILGAAYDPATQRIFISQASGDGELPVIHIFKVSVAPYSE